VDDRLDLGDPGGENAVMPDPAEPLRYRLITGPDDAEFCARISRLLDQGYRLYGSPAVTFDGSGVIAAQAVVWAGPASPEPAETPRS
jgi:hypothetical protein